MMKERNLQIPRLGTRMFMHTMGILTSGQQKMQQCVDYMVGVLVFENVRTLQYITSRSVEEVLVRTKLLDQLNAVSDFLKYSFEVQLDKDDEFAHGTRRSLVGKLQIGEQEECETKWSDCLKRFHLVENI